MDKLEGAGGEVFKTRLGADYRDTLTGMACLGTIEVGITNALALIEDCGLAQQRARGHRPH